MRMDLDRMADDDLLTSSEVAALFRVAPKTVGRWVSAGVLPAMRTPGGRYRFRVADIRAAMRRSPASDSDGQH